VSGNGRDDDDRDPPAPDARQADGEEEGRNDESGLVGVDADPRRPLTRDEVETLRRENEELRNQLLRRRADFDNYRKRVERDRQEMGTEAVANLLRELLPSMDNLDRALEAGGSPESLRDGVELIRRDLLGVLEAQGVTVEDPAGQPFDPLRHQALSHDPAPGVPEGTVVSVLRRGYSFRDRLLRPALVTVAKGSDDETEPGSNQVH
jgi:molecular chaperone GrpE